MIDADGNGRTYIELQVAPNGNIFDTYLPSPRRYEDTIDPKMKPFSWNSKLVAKVHVDGTLNKRDDKDKGWTVELAHAARGRQGDGRQVGACGCRPSRATSGASTCTGWTCRRGSRSRPPAGRRRWSVTSTRSARFGELVFADADGKMPPPAAGGQAAGAGEGAPRAGRRQARERRAGADGAAGSQGARRGQGRRRPRKEVALARAGARGAVARRGARRRRRAGRRVGAARRRRAPTDGAPAVRAAPLVPAGARPSALPASGRRGQRRAAARSAARRHRRGGARRRRAGWAAAAGRPTRGSTGR